MSKQRIQIFNPHGGKRSGKAKSKRNPLSELIFMSNPARHGKKKKSHHNPFGKKKSKSNKRRTHIFARGHGHRHSNPRRSGGDEGFKGWLELGGGGLAGLFGSNFIAELAFGGYNSGITGYLITGGIGLAITLAAGKFFGKKAATGAGLGTGLAIAYRIYQDYANIPTGKVNAVVQSKGLPAGNSDFASGMGTYTQVAFPYPVNYQYAGGGGSGLALSPGMPSGQPAYVPAAGNPPGSVPTNSLERDARY
jgi:hypothetical protein